VPDELKRIIYATKIYKYLDNIKFNYYKSHKKYLFFNVKYLSHIDVRTNNAFYRSAVNDYRKFINLNKFKKNSKYKYVIISRENNKRKLLNEDELLNFLKPLGFVKIHFEKLNLNKQIEISCSAKIMIGYHGAGLSNSFFMQRNNYLIDIVNSFYNHPFYNLYSEVLGLNYKKFLCSKSFKNLDGECDAKEIQQYIKKIL
jgi:hypothetical protein